MGRVRRLTRRQFLARAASGAALAPIVARSSAFGANDAITMGCIGMGGRGRTDMRAFMGFRQVRVLAVCDVIESHRNAAKAMVNGRYGNSDCKTYNDFRRILERHDIDTILVATPDHWHAIIGIQACEAGKDVFSEKPLTLTLREGREMVKAARRYGRVFSSGSQRVYGDYGRLARYIRSGAIGQVKEAYVGVGGPSRPCHLPPQPVPPGIDWDMWLGPAPWAPFNRGRLNFRPWRDYSGGGMTDWGAHKFGAVIFAMDLQETGPVEIHPPDGKEHKYLTYVFANGFRMYHARGHDITYVGTEGRASRRQMGPAPANVPIMTYKGRGGLPGDFLYCVRTRERPFRDVEYGHRAASVCHLGNLAYRLERPLRWDPVKEEFIGDDEANRLRERPKREPWTL